MTTCPPGEGLRAYLCEQRKQSTLVTQPGTAIQCVYAVVDTVMALMIRHLAQRLWEEGIPVSVISEWGEDPPYSARRLDQTPLGVFVWPSAGPDSFFWAHPLADGPDRTHTFKYQVLTAARRASRFERTLEGIIGSPNTTGPSSHHSASNDVGTDVSAGHQSARL